MFKESISKINFLNLIAVLVIVFSISIIIFGFWKSDLSSWDMPGHVFASYYYQKYLWPSYSGWNFLAFNGYPQGYLYPSFFHWLVGGLAKLIGLTLSFKIILTLSLLLLPLSIFLWLKSLLKNKKEEIFLALIWIFVFFFTVKYDIGGDFYSTFSIGLVTAQFTLPFVFLYLYFLKKSLEDKKNYIFSSIFLSIVILSHAFIGLGTLIFSFAYFISFFFKKHEFFWFILHFIFSFLLTAFWIIPYLYFSKYSHGVIVGKEVPLHPIIFIVFFASLIYGVIKKDYAIKFTLIFLIFFFLFFGLIQILTYNKFLEKSIHLYRFLIFIYILIGLTISRLFLKKPKFGIIFSSIILLMAIFFSFKTIFPFWERKVEFKVVGFKEYLGLVPSEIDDYFFKNRAPHVLSHHFLLNDHKLLNGLFVESSSNSKSIQSLITELYKNPFNWGLFSYEPNQDLIKEHLDYLGVCWIMSYYPLEQIQNSDIKYSLIKAPLQIKIDKISWSQKIFIYFLPESCHQFKVVTFPEGVLLKDWEKEIYQWWKDKMKLKKPLIGFKNKKDKEDLLREDFVYQKDASVELIEFKPPAYYKFKISSQYPQFVYLKIPYFPNWHAYQNGKEIKIYRASPSYMIIKAQGEIELKFEKSNLEKISLIISIASFFFILLLGKWFKKLSTVDY